MTTMRSAISIASCWSCVTITVVTRKRRLQVLDLGAQLLAHLGVERRQRLVEQQHRRLRRQRARERHALLLAAGQLMRILLGLVAQVHERQHLVDPRRDRVASATSGTRGRSRCSCATDMLGNSEYDWKTMPKLRRRAGTPSEARAVLRHVAGIGCLEAGDDAQQRRLAAAGGAEEADEFAFADVEADVVQRQDGAEPLGDVGAATGTRRVPWVAGRRAPPVIPRSLAPARDPATRSACAGSGERGGYRSIFCFHSAMMRSLFFADAEKSILYSTVETSGGRPAFSTASGALAPGTDDISERSP